jgi:small nuclear ribonucleoprotein (snRNP)-like protein
MRQEMYEQQTQSYPLVDKGTILSYVNPKDDIIALQQDLLGIEVTQYKDGGVLKSTVRRINKPVFTDEAVKELTRHLKSSLNFTVQVTRFDDEQIKNQMKSFLKSTNLWLNTIGYDHYISDAVWDKIVEIHESTIEDKTSGWNKFGINWKYNSPVTFDMLKRIELKQIETENDQTVVFGNILAELKLLALASLNKSIAMDSKQVQGQFLKSLSDVRTESTTIQSNNEKKGFFNRGQETGGWN